MAYTSLISTGDLHRYVGENDWVIVDCRFSLHSTERGRKNYHEAHIPGAVYAHLDEDLSGPVLPGETGRHPLPSLDAMARRFGGWGISDEVQVVAYDDAGGAIAARLWWMLQYAGHDAAAVLDGGWPAWRREGLPVRRGVERNEPRTFVPKPREHLVVGTPDVDRLRKNPDWKILDARDSERYRGEIEPIDRVAGHIPGALSVPFKENLTDDGAFRSQDELRKRFRAVLGSTSTEHVVHHCGSGVTACHNVLAMRHAGLGDAKLYPGSWSEWITDPNREVATEHER